MGSDIRPKRAHFNVDVRVFCMAPLISVLSTGTGIKLHGFRGSEFETEFIVAETLNGDEYFRHGIQVPPGAIVVDCGANIGLFGAAVLLQTPDVRYLGIEAMPDTCEALRLNLHGVDGQGTDSIFSMNPSYRAVLTAAQPGRLSPPYPQNISTLCAAVSNTAKPAAEITFYPSMPGNSTLRSQEKEMLQKRFMPELFAGSTQVTVRVVTLHEVLQQHNLEHVDLLKVDVEGEELAALKGLLNEDWSKIDQVVLEVHDCIDAPSGESEFDLEGERGGGIDGTDIRFCTDVANLSPEAAKRVAAVGLGLLPPLTRGRTLAVAQLLRDKGFRVVIECTLGVPLNYNVYARKVGTA